MAKKVSIAISHALTVSITAPGGPVSLPHTVAPDDDDVAPPSLPHTEASDDDEFAPPSLPHTEAPDDDEFAPPSLPHTEAPKDFGSIGTLPHTLADFDPLSMLINGPNEVGSLTHGVVTMELPDPHRVSRVEVKRLENGDLLITLHE